MALSAEQFRKQAHDMVDWMADYLENIERYPVKSQVAPREIYDQLPAQAPNEGEAMAEILEDFQRIILPGITHWQSPNFFAYFPGTSSYASVLAEMLTATLGAQCMIWDTSPAAAELEEKVMNWLLDMLGLPQDWEGVIQPTASDSTLCALLSAREQKSDFRINQEGFSGQENFRVYCSEQTHSSIEKGVKIAGFGKENTVKVEVDEDFAMSPQALEAAIQADIAAGKQPLCVVATIGTTSSTALDPIGPLAEICQRYNVWLHIDAAYAGTALLLPELRWMSEGIEAADSFVFNPHKWMFTNFDCSVYFVKDAARLKRTFEIMPEYLKTTQSRPVNNYRDWGIPLGRRFRALKLWFVIRDFGVEGLRKKIRQHNQWIQALAAEMEAHSDYEVLAPVPLNLVCFRYAPAHIPQDQLDALNEAILQALNQSGKLYLTHTRLRGTYTLRLVAGHTHVTQAHVQQAWLRIQETAASIAESFKG